jgi:hypothetical protein
MRVYAAGVFQRIAVFPHEFQALSTRTRKKARAADFLYYAVLWAFLLGHFSIRVGPAPVDSGAYHPMIKEIGKL